MTDPVPPPPGELLCVIAVGRSGSTLLQRLLNLHEQVVLFGEHNAIVGSLANLWQQTFDSWARGEIERSSRFVPDILAARPVAMMDGISIEWANAFTEERALPVFRRFLEDLLYPPEIRRADTRYWGFKEIRYGPPAVAFLARLFPQARFLVLLRDPLAVHRSRLATGYWYPRLSPEAAAAQMQEEFQSLCDVWELLRSRPGTQARLLSYEMLLPDPQPLLDRIAAWAGLTRIDPGLAAALMAAPGRSEPDADPDRTERFLDLYRSGAAARDQARWRALLEEAARQGLSLGPAAPADGPPHRHRQRRW